MSAGIYRITNHITNQIYVGYSVNLDKRKRDYIKNRVHGQTMIHESLLKYGYQNHTFDVLLDFDEYTPTIFELKKFESVFIFYYKYWKGCTMLNCNDGGGGCGRWSEEKKRKKSINMKLSGGWSKKKQVLQYDLYGNFIKEWESINIASITLRINYNLIIISCKSNNLKKIAGGFLWCYKTNNTTPQKIENYRLALTDRKSNKFIIQYDLNGNFIREWESIIVAKKELNIPIQDITKSIHNRPNKKFKRIQQQFQWKFLTENYPLKIDPYIVPAVIVQYDLNGNFIKEWKNTNEIATDLNISVKNIRSCLTGYIKKTNGYQWKRFADGKYPQQINSLVKFENIEKENPIKLLQYDLMGNYIRYWEYPQIVENEINISASSIKKCINGELKRAGKYQWRYGTLENIKNIDPVWIISQSDCNGHFIKDWYGLKEIKEQTNYNISQISQCIKGKCAVAHNFVWKYK